MKKFFALILAVAVTLSTTVFASPVDVPVDAVYSQAVEELIALNIVNGYNDGSFKPENTITRAEVTKMIVAAMAQTSSAKSAAGVTKFTDVPADHWASGYINVGTDALKFINGMGDGRFAPEDNVTYEQAVKMVVAAIGYDSLAVINGGYPTGYLTVAKQIGITENIKSIDGTAPATRAIVAQLISNAIDTPLLAMTTFNPFNPEYEIMDGTNGKTYETILTNYHNTYKVEGRVTANSKSDSALENDEVKFTIESTKNYDGEIVKKSDENPIENIVMNVGKTTAADYLGIYSKVLVKIDENEDPIILTCLPSGKNSVTTVYANAFDDEADNDIFAGNNKGKIYYYSNVDKTGKSTKYYVTDDFKLYVNGVEVDVDEENVQKYIFENKFGTISFVDTPNENSNSTDGKYDSIFVSYYATGIVESMSNNKIYFDVATDMTSIVTDDEDKTYNFYLNNKSIELLDIQEKDVVSIAYDVTTDIENSDFYDVYISRDIVEGRVTEVNEEDNEVIIDGVIYGMVSDTLVNSNDFELGTSYTVYVDIFGNAVDYEKLASTVKYGIISRAYYSKDADENKIVLYDTTATKKTYSVADNFTYINGKNEGNIDNLINDMSDSADASIVFDRVVFYETNSKGEIREIETLNPTTGTDVVYNERSSKIGNIKFDNNTVIISVDEKDFSVVKGSSLIDEGTYTVAGFDKDSGIYGIVLITEGIGSYTSDSRFAVVEKVTQGTNDNGDECDKLAVYTAGSDELQTVYCDGTEIAKIAKGDVIIYTVNAEGLIEDASDINVIFSISNGNEINTPDKWINDEDVEVVFGPVINRTSSTITIGEVSADNTTNIDDAEDYDYSDDVAVYVYDYNNSSSKRISVGTVSSVVKTIVPKVAMDEDEVIIDWSHEEAPEAVNALVKIVDDEVTDVFVIIPKD